VTQEAKVSSGQMIQALELCITLLPLAKTMRDGERIETERVLRATVHVMLWLDDKRHALARFMLAEKKETSL
jgi:hypothetical protein